MRVTLIGSGGLSHDPPTPRLDMSPPDVARRLIVRHTPTQDELDARESRVSAARELVIGRGPCLPPSEQWDRDFLGRFVGGRLDGFRHHDRRRDRPRRRLRRARGADLGGRGRRRRRIGKLRTELRYYHLVPEWITGMGVVVGRGDSAAKLPMDHMLQCPFVREAAAMRTSEAGTMRVDSAAIERSHRATSRSRSAVRRTRPHADPDLPRTLLFLL